MLNEAMLRNMGPREIARELLDHADPTVRLFAGLVEGQRWIPETEATCRYGGNCVDEDEFAELEDQITDLDMEARRRDDIIVNLADALRAHEPDHPALERAK